jgi:acyl-coenzyme A thioesterase PaaI-like protein
MNLANTLRRFAKILPEPKLLELYPPFLFMGVKIKKVSPDYRHMHVVLPMRWYGKNLYGTMFGGFMCAVSDPLPALMCEKIFPGVEVWTKAHAVDFKKPGKGHLDLYIDISEKDVGIIGRALDETGKCTHPFQFSFKDSHGREVAHVHNTVYLRRKR